MLYNIFYATVLPCKNEDQGMLHFLNMEYLNMEYLIYVSVDSAIYLMKHENCVHDEHLSIIHFRGKIFPRNEK